MTLKTEDALKDSVNTTITYDGLLDNAVDANTATGKMSVVYHKDQRLLALPEAGNGMLKHIKLI